MTRCACKMAHNMSLYSAQMIKITLFSAVAFEKTNSSSMVEKYTTQQPLSLSILNINRKNTDFYKRKRERERASNSAKYTFLYTSNSKEKGRKRGRTIYMAQTLSGTALRIIFSRVGPAATLSPVECVRGSTRGCTRRLKVADL